MPHYIRLGYDHGLPVLMVRQGHVSWGSELLPHLRQWRAKGLPTFDALVTMDLKQSAHDRLAQAKKAFDESAIRPHVLSPPSGARHPRTQSYGTRLALPCG